MLVWCTSSARQLFSAVTIVSGRRLTKVPWWRPVDSVGWCVYRAFSDRPSTHRCSISRILAALGPGAVRKGVLEGY
ncbi:hypothetical protein DAEQUDRAFT_261596 [Daedalea quercina L-15889]|uniref:Uncharacterized protein n=1 Tax=Daedalea quercina L-15889 TaxID=1314783 RepID=A0A165QEM2_9APHY|nr:hypothetical protein DAEQUDRAFT_261596 [Daedalea quercina L-15889]